LGRWDTAVNVYLLFPFSFSSSKKRKREKKSKDAVNREIWPVYPPARRKKKEAGAWPGP